jgi:hypothetical protein
MTRSSLPPPSPVDCNDPPNAVALHSGGTSADNDEDNLQSRVARNAHTPFGQLPDDILIHIAKDACTDASTLMGRSPRALEVMSMVHGRLRALLLRTAELWASVSFAWRIPRLETYAARSLPSCPLAVRFNLWSTKTERCARLAQYLPYTRALTVLWDERFEHLLYGRTDAADATLLETLTVSRFDRGQGPFRPDFLNNASWSCLRELQLTSVSATSFPNMPNLVCITLVKTGCSIYMLHSLFQHSPLLTSISLDLAVMDAGLSVSTNLIVAPLVQLKHVKIADTMEHIACLVTILPIPGEMFELEVRSDLDMLVEHGRPTRHTKGAEDVVISKLLAFCTPTTLIIRTLDTALVGPFMQYIHHLGIAAFRPYLDMITNLVIERTSLAALELQEFERPPTEDSDDEQADSLVTEAEKVDRQTGILELERWILGRHMQGTPLVSIRFHRCCDDVRPLHDRMMRAQAARTINWDN